MMKMEKSMKICGQLSSDEIAGDWGDIRPLNRATLTVRIFLLVLSVLTIYALATIDYQSVGMAKAVADTLHNFKIIFLEPEANRLNLWEAFYEIVITMGLAFLTTLFSGIIALFLGLMAAKNLSPKTVTRVIKGFVAFIRSVPTILWVLIFAVSAGLGSVAAVIGLTFHSISYLTKAFSESFEELDRSVIEALMASGANWWQIVFQAVIPSSVTYLLSWTFLRFEINFANAVAMGAAAGAGGIGFDLFMDSGFYFDLREIGLITYILIAFAMVLEAISTNIKGKIKTRA
ncbi:phosphonate transport system permease protein [Sporomusaceae bacterium BoRhaA]|nr:phosphonate transport system permease protein [Pelorhabdus rhamnosifermentans]